MGLQPRPGEELIELYLSEIIGAQATVVIAHDRGDSVALLHAARCAEGRSATRLEHLVLSNGDIFLPLSNLTPVQRQALDATSWPQIAAAVTPAVLAEGMGAALFTPPRKPGDPEVDALTATFAHDNGIKVLREGIQYLVERSKLAERDLRLLLCPGGGLEVELSPGQRVDARVHDRAERPAG